MQKYLFAVVLEATEDEKHDDADLFRPRRCTHRTEAHHQAVSLITMRS